MWGPGSHKGKLQKLSGKLNVGSGYGRTTNQNNLANPKNTKLVLNYLLSVCGENKTPCISVSVYDINLLALLDSGANCIILGQCGWDVVRKLGVVLRKCEDFIELPNKSKLSCLGYVELPIKLEDRVGYFKVYVIPEVKHALILGTNFWYKLGLVPDVRKGVWFFSKDEIANKQLMCNTVHLIDKSRLGEEQVNQLQSVVNDYFESIKDIELGCTNLVEHAIEVNPSVSPVKAKYNRVNPNLQKIIDAELDEMLRLGVVRPSLSEWSSPVVIVKKKDGGFRFAIDYRKVNAVSKLPAYPIPNMMGILENLRESRFISGLDIRSAYWQVPMQENSKQYTAFAVPGRGLFEFNRLPYGLHGAPGTFQALIDKLIDISLEPFVFAYLDDIVIATPDFETHINVLREVFNRLKLAGLTLKRSKCEFCKESLKYLGYIVTRDGLRADPEKIAAIVNMPPPKNIRQTRSLVGMLSFYRRFIPNFSSLLDPILALTRKKVKWKWNEHCELAFNKVKEILIQSPILAVPDFSKPFTVHCDASGIGLGACLTQEVDGCDRVICYLSRTLSPTERRYSVTEQECLCVIWAVEKLRCYLEGSGKFKVITDNYSLLWLLKQNPLSGRIARWILRLQSFDFEIAHRPGRNNVIPDHLSRAVQPGDSECKDLKLNMLENDSSDSDNDSVNESNVSTVNSEDEDERMADKWYEKMVDKIESDPLHFPNWRVLDGKLYKRFRLNNHDPVNCENEWKVVVPKYKRRNILYKFHNDAACGGHFGVYKTYNKIMQNYYWPQMKCDVTKFVRRCTTCAKVKPEQKRPAGLMGTRPEITRPWQLISSDLFGPLPRTASGYEYILVVSDYFSKFPLLFPLKRVSAANVIQKIEEQVFMVFGVPEFMIVDNGVQFGRSNEFQNLLKQYNVKPLYNSYYTPQNNPTERVNRVIKTLIQAYIDLDHRQWDVNLSKLGCAMRTVKHEATRQTPYFINFGQEMIVDAKDYESLKDNGILNEVKDINNEERDDEKHRLLQRVRELVAEVIKKAHNKAKLQYDKSRRDQNFNVGDYVWRKAYPTTDMRRHFTAKLADRYKGPFRIKTKCGLNVYELEDGNNQSLGRWHIKDLKLDKTLEQVSSDEDEELLVDL